MENTKISIIMPVYNEGKYIKESIDSILNQTFKDFELIIIDDGSTDNTKEIITEYSDERIRLIKNKVNLGITKSLNVGIANSKGKYIARMDADDISTQNRLEIQYNFLERNKDIGVIGSQTLLFKDNSKKVIYKYKPTHFEEIKATFFYHNPMVHPSIMIRKSILIENKLLYDENLKASQDYDMWINLSKVTKIVNLPDVLVFYRLRENSITQKSRKLVKERHFYILKKMFDLVELDLSNEDIELYCDCVLGVKSNVDFKKLNCIFNKIIKSSIQANYTNEKLLKQRLGIIWLKQFRSSKFTLNDFATIWTIYGGVYLLKYFSNNIFFKLNTPIRSQNLLANKNL